jgi:multiple sugar transport system substrate-binding protein
MKEKLSYKDPRVVEVFKYVKELVDAGAYPKSFATLKLGESHYYFHTKPGALMFPMGAFYTGRAFVPPDKGGQPENFPLGIMSFPAMDRGACNLCKTLTVGASFGINATTKYPKLAAGMLNEMATPEMGASWLSTSSQTATSDRTWSLGHIAHFAESVELKARNIHRPPARLGSAARPSSR